MRIIGNDQKNNGQNFWEILERIIGKISCIIGAGLDFCYVTCVCISGGLRAIYLPVYIKLPLSCTVCLGI